jgi:hypothetical protein
MYSFWEVENQQIKRVITNYNLFEELGYHFKQYSKWARLTLSVYIILKRQSLNKANLKNSKT